MSMTDWNAAIKFVLKEEGGYTNDPNDKGGETIFGISRVNWPKWSGWAVVDSKKSLSDFPANVNGDAELLKCANDFYVPNFWQANHCDELPSPLAIAVFDASVNQGVKPAGKMLQIALGNVAIDGDVGEETITAAHKAAPSLIRKFLAQRMARYARRIMEKPDQEVFIENWSARLMRCAEIVLPKETV